MRLPEQPSGNGLAFSAAGGRRESVSHPRIGELPSPGVPSPANGFPTVLAASEPPAPSRSLERRIEPEPSRGGYRDGSRIGDNSASSGPESSDRSAEDEDDADETTEPTSAPAPAGVTAADPAGGDAEIETDVTVSQIGLAVGQERPEGIQNPLVQAAESDAESRPNPTADGEAPGTQTMALNAERGTAPPANGTTAHDAGSPAVGTRGAGTPDAEKAATETSVSEQAWGEPTETAKSESDGRPVAGATTGEAIGTDPSSIRSVDAASAGGTSGQQTRAESQRGAAPDPALRNAVSTTGEMAAGGESSEPSTGRQRGRTGGPSAQRDSRGRPGQVGDNPRGDARGETGADRPAGAMDAAGMANGVAATGQTDAVSPPDSNLPQTSFASPSSTLDAAIASGANPGSSTEGGGSATDAGFATESPSANAASGGDAAGQFGDRPAADSATMPSRTDIADRARLIHRIAKAFSKMGTDGGQIRMKMHPEELGGVLLEMQVRGRTVEARVTVESEAARGLLQQQLSELRQRLEGQGLTVEKLEVALRDDTTAEDPTGNDRGRHGFAGGDHGFAGQNGSAGIDGLGSKRKGSRSGPDSRIAGAGINTGLANTRQSAARQPAAPGTLDLRL